ncbi:uracil-DNA glycosylase [Achromobacter ruhlandii]|uniref:uracil-DNA glycosylase n=1 Tax=Achromobacter ruhlandii TaxID=72557 RepID=UPI0021F2448B|nr:uracil-DNA glycosylase [Achromobacter ruhlandii]MCV6794423.1 uracil-DNA glycosylase [Achromobacter ruhlandii]MCV6801332.1 uracil-DNA glycosylase [Achromobacter ruhlandii]MCV6812271.1 uracil-DNA glycosylase [Achromobacter ruhlandii]MCV6817440.1 uracil-DNA glycosylase [Achromobacter ruhlandii]
MPTDNRLIPNALAAQTAQLPASWQAALRAPRVAEALQAVTAHVERRLAEGAVVYPATPLRALQGLEPTDVRVVILGQDPYHGPGQAQGLAFSVPDDCKRPPSLRNIFNEIAQEYPGTPLPTGNDLSPWAEQGVLLLNTALTVEDGQPASHAKRGWETVTDALIAWVAQDPSPKVFMLWGAHAQAKQALLPHDSGHLVLMANHPSPLSARRPPVPFLGCGHFLATNRRLVDQGKNPIDWKLDKKIIPVQGEFGL